MTIAPPGPEAAIGFDIGGTFTDVVLVTGTGALHRAKTLTTPDDPVRGALAGIELVLAQSGLAARDVSRLVHATTLATNTVLEQRGASLAFVTTQGFRTLLALGHYSRVEQERYDLLYEPPESPVPLSHCFEIPERLAFDGSVIVPLDEAEARAVVAQIAALAVQSVAICFLHSYANPDHEQRMADLCRELLPGVVVVASSDAWREIREYDRASTTVVSAYVGPVMAEYLARLEAAVVKLGIDARLQIMESSGGVMSASQAARRAVSTIESGPAAGVIAAAHLGRTTGRANLISFDMGGTTAKAGVVRDGRPDITREFHVGGTTSAAGHRSSSGLPVKAPAIDLAEVGSGGGSIAWVDDGGALRVGPRSAGAHPGPACYALGGVRPTVTDANLVLGYLEAGSFARGTMELDPQRSVEAIEKDIAVPLGLNVTAAAHAIHEIANSNMAAAVDVVTVQRGVDPRGFTIVAFGGAGPMHVARVAEQFDIRSILVPVASGVASALGLLATDLTVDRVRTVLTRTLDADVAALESVFAELAAEAAAELGADLDDETVTVRRSVDVRYVGQAHELTVAAPGVIDGGTGLQGLESGFFAEYLRSYGIDLPAPTEIVNLRATVSQGVPKLTLAADIAELGRGRATERPAYFPTLGGFVSVPVHTRAALRAGEPVIGPAIVEEPEATLVVPPGWSGAVDELGNLVLERDES